MERLAALRRTARFCEWPLNASCFSLRAFHTSRYQEPWCRNRHGHAAAAPAILDLLLENLVCEIPGQNQGDIGLLIQQRFWTAYPNVMAGCYQALLEGTAVNDKG